MMLTSVLITGCSTNYTYPSRKIRVLKKSGVLKEFELLSLRSDSAIVVLDWIESKVVPKPLSHAEVIHRDSIGNITRSSQGNSKVLIGAGIGLVSGVALDLLLPGIAPGFFTVFRGRGGAVVVLTLTGALVGLMFESSMTMDLSLVSAKDREFLRTIALYPEKEPEEMQYIK
ncbi:MAG: hypothetical protein ACHQM6_03285 [Candidatus Kapaibacterium sp.]